MPGGPGKRHHVRFWQWDQLYEGRHGWFGAATFDSKVGLSHTTGQVTHHIAPDVDAERDRLVGELQQAGVVSRSNGWTASTPMRRPNGGGDPWHTDGRLRSSRCASRARVASVECRNALTRGRHGEWDKPGHDKERYDAIGSLRSRPRTKPVLDIRWIRDNPDAFLKGLTDRGFDDPRRR